MAFHSIKKVVQQTTEHEIVVKVIAGKRLIPLKTLGEGAFSVVQLFKEEDTGKMIAGKRLNASTDTLPAIKHEIEIMKLLPPHPNLVSFIGHEIHSTGQGRYEVWVLMEAVSGGSVVNKMQSMQAKRATFTAKEILNIFVDVATGIAVMHSQSPPISHRDLKVENVLIGDDGSHKLCDFGSATQRAYKCSSQRDVTRATEDIERNTTLAYRAPEAVDPWQRMRIDEKQDVWALGVLLYYLCFFKLPFEETNLAILGGRYTITPSSFTEHNPDIIELIKMMLNLDPSKRPDVFTVLGVACRLAGVAPTISKPSDILPQPVGDEPIPTAQSPRQQAPPAPAPAPATTAAPQVPAPVPAPAPQQTQLQGDLFSQLEWSDPQPQVFPPQTAPAPPPPPAPVVQQQTVSHSPPTATMPTFFPSAPSPTTQTDDFFSALSTPTSASPTTSTPSNLYGNIDIFGPPQPAPKPSVPFDPFSNSSPPPQQQFGKQPPQFPPAGFGASPASPVHQQPKAPPPGGVNDILAAFNSGGIGLGGGFKR